MKNRLLSRTSVWMLMLLLIFAATGMAQDYRGRIEGLVTDESKAVIAGATVTLLNVNTGIRVVRKTSDTGLYLFDLVDPGTYTVTVEATGFTGSFKRTSWSRRAATSPSTPSSTGSGSGKHHGE